MGSYNATHINVKLDPEVETLNPEVRHEAVECLDDALFIGCKSDHKSLKRRDELTIEDLPDEIRDENLLKLICHNADLVGRVKRQETSKKSHPHSGSGSVCYFSDTYDLFPCSHNDSGEPKELTDWKDCAFCHIPNCPYTKKFGEDHYVITNFVPELSEEQKLRTHIAFRVSTNLHVVGSCSEAARTQFELFFDGPSQNSDITDKIIAQGVCLCAQWDEQDKVHMVCVADWQERLQNLLCTMRQEFWKHFNNLPAHIKDLLCTKYVILISHPHGCSKYISFGENQGCRDVREFNAMYVETRYNACSCKGSSGGVVLGPGWVQGGPAYRVHCGVDENTGHKVSKSFWVTKGVGTTQVHKDNRDNYIHERPRSFINKLKRFFTKVEPCCPNQSHKALPNKV